VCDLAVGELSARALVRVQVSEGRHGTYAHACGDEDEARLLFHPLANQLCRCVSGRLRHAARVAAGVVRCRFYRRGWERLRCVGEQLCRIVWHRLRRVDLRHRLRKWCNMRRVNQRLAGFCSDRAVGYEVLVAWGRQNAGRSSWEGAG
jgi:hypothetical protein